MVILQNTKDALKEKEKEKHIEIHLYKENEQIILTIYNNATAGMSPIK